MPGGCLDMPGALIGPLRANGGPSGNPQVRALRALRSSSSKWIWLRRSQAKSPLTRSGAWSIERVDSGRTFVRVAVEARDRATGGGGIPGSLTMTPVCGTDPHGPCDSPAPHKRRNAERLIVELAPRPQVRAYADHGGGLSREQRRDRGARVDAPGCAALPRPADRGETAPGDPMRGHNHLRARCSMWT